MSRSFPPIWQNERNFYSMMSFYLKAKERQCQESAECAKSIVEGQRELEKHFVDIIIHSFQSGMIHDRCCLPEARTVNTEAFVAFML